MKNVQISFDEKLLGERLPYRGVHRSKGEFAQTFFCSNRQPSYRSEKRFAEVHGLPGFGHKAGDLTTGEDFPLLGIQALGASSHDTCCSAG